MSKQNKLICTLLLITTVLSVISKPIAEFLYEHINTSLSSPSIFLVVITAIITIAFTTTLIFIRRYGMNLVISNKAGFLYLLFYMVVATPLIMRGFLWSLFLL